MHYAYVDTRSFLSDGQKVSAVDQGRIAHAGLADREGVTDLTYRLDWAKVKRMINVIGENARITLYGVDMPGMTMVWHSARDHGMTVNLVPAINPAHSTRLILGRMMCAMFKDAYSAPDKGKHRVTLISGDASYEPAVRSLATDGFDVKVAYWAHASLPLVNAAPKFIPMNRFVRDLELPGTGMLFR